MVESAGIIPYKKDGGLKIFLVHMGGPYWRKRERSWSIVKGEAKEGEDLLEAAKREFLEETGQEIDGRFTPLGTVKSSNKRLTAWAVEASPDTKITSNDFQIEWPPGSGRLQSFPEADRAGWFTPKEAAKIVAGYQVPLIERLENLLKRD